MPNANEVSEAVVVWTGFREMSWPSREVHRLVERYGPDVAPSLLIAVKRWEDDFHASEAALTAKSLFDIGEEAAARFRALHPEASEDAIEALAWCYTFDHK